MHCTNARQILPLTHVPWDEILLTTVLCLYRRYLYSFKIYTTQYFLEKMSGRETQQKDTSVVPSGENKNSCGEELMVGNDTSKN